MPGDNGRTRPKLLLSPERKGCKLAALGSFGYAARTAQAAGLDGIGLIAPESVKQSVAAMLVVRKFFPSKIRESTARLRKAISVTTAPAARITDFPWSPNRVCRNPCVKLGLHATPSRGCQLFLSEPHAGSNALPCKQPPGTSGSWIVPPLNAPFSTSYRKPEFMVSPRLTCQES